MQTRLSKSVRDLPGIGPRAAEMLEAAGIRTPDELRKHGAVSAYIAVKRASGSASLNLLWALEGGLTGQPWQTIAREERGRLLVELDAAESQP